MLIAAAALTLDPAVVGLSTYTPVAHLVALRGALALGLVLVAAALGMCALLVRHRGEDRPTRLTLVCGVLTLVATLHVGVLVSRGPSASAALPDDKGPGEIDVLALNTYGAVDGAAAIAKVLAEHRADVVVLSEIRLGSALQVAGDDYAVHLGIGRAGRSAPTALLVAGSMGEYEPIDGPELEYGLVGAAPVSGDGPTLYAVHVASPVGRRMQLWRDELELVMGLCAETTNVIIAGDYNATVDHAPLRETSCVDGSVGSGGVGTWPAGLPAALGTPIDHVFTDPGSWTPIASAVITLPETDHRGVLVRLSPS